jgi:hypothetical protein
MPEMAARSPPITNPEKSSPPPQALVGHRRCACERRAWRPPQLAPWRLRAADAQSSAHPAALQKRTLGSATRADTCCHAGPPIANHSLHFQQSSRLVPPLHFCVRLCFACFGYEALEPRACWHLPTCMFPCIHPGKIREHAALHLRAGLLRTRCNRATPRLSRFPIPCTMNPLCTSTAFRT